MAKWKRDRSNYNLWWANKGKSSIELVEGPDANIPFNKFAVFKNGKQNRRLFDTKKEATSFIKRLMK